MKSDMLFGNKPDIYLRRAQGCAWPLGHTHSLKVDALHSALHHCAALAQAELQTPQSVWDNNLNPNPYPPS